MIYVLSGGPGKLFAAIGVTYPEGSTLTCTKGTKTLKAKTTSGQWVFAIPEAGEWTVTATDGTNTKSQTVSITAEGQLESVTLSYALILFDGGDNTDVTGGWELDGHAGPALSVETTLSYSYSGSTTSAGTTKRWVVLTADQIDLSEYTSLQGTVESMAGAAELCVMSSLDCDASPVSLADISVGTGSLDISSLTNSYYVGFRITSTSDNYANLSSALTVSKVWLE